MSTRNDLYEKYYGSDIFNLNPHYEKVLIVKPKVRFNHPTYDRTREDVFNISQEKRIRRSVDKRNPEKKLVMSRSAIRRRDNYDHIYGSDIFNRRRPTSGERRTGVKQIPNKTNISTCFDEMRNVEEYTKDLKYYTRQHRAEKKEYNPDKYINYITPQERYYKDHFVVHGDVVLPESNYLKTEKNDDDMNQYIHKKLNLKKEINRYNNVGADKKGIPGENNSYREKRYTKQKPRLFEGKRKFIDSTDFPQNNCRINKQNQMESQIFSNKEKNDKDYDKEVKEINERIEREKRKRYNANVLGQPYMEVYRDLSNNDRSYFGAVHTKWGRSNIDWTSPDTEIMFGKTFNDGINKNYGPKGPTPFERKLNQLADSQNLDTLSGRKLYPIVGIHKKNKKEEEIENIGGMKKFDDIIDENPYLDDGQKLGIKMKASVLDSNNDDDWIRKGRDLNDFYSKGYRKRKQEKEVTGKPNDKRDSVNNEYKNFTKTYNDNNNLYHDYVITYATKGNQFEKFDEVDIKKLFGAKGIQAYDVHKNPFDKGNYNTITLKIKGNDNKELYDRVKMVQNDLRKKNYKLNIERGAVKNHGIKHGRMVKNPGAKIGIVHDASTKNYYDGSQYKIMPPEMLARKGFAKQFAHVNYGYKKPVNL